MNALTTPEVPPYLFLVLGFFAGFICAIWLAIAIEDANKKMAEEIEEEMRKGPK